MAKFPAMHVSIIYFVGLSANCLPYQIHAGSRAIVNCSGCFANQQINKLAQHNKQSAKEIKT
jgi:hypothetical protein